MKKLYRPIGLKELQLILDTQQEKFPPRLSWQPIFYPVLNFEYAKHIAERWNSKDYNSSYVGFVTSFDVDELYISKFEDKVVGDSNIHRELWIPSEELAEFNLHIIGKIQVIDAFYGQEYKGIIPDSTGLKGKGAIEHFIALEASYDYAPMDFYCELINHWYIILINFKFWLFYDFTNYKIYENRKLDVLSRIYNIWKDIHGDLRLPGEEYITG